MSNLSRRGDNPQSIQDGTFSRQMSRRGFLRIASLGTGLVAVSPLLAACGGGKESVAATSTQSAIATSTTAYDDIVRNKALGAARMEGAQTAIASFQTATPTNTEIPTATASATATTGETTIPLAADTPTVGIAAEPTKQVEDFGDPNLKKATPRPTLSNPEDANPFEHNLGRAQALQIGDKDIANNAFVEVQGDIAFQDEEGNILFKSDDIANTGQLTLIQQKGTVVSLYGGDAQTNVTCEVAKVMVESHKDLMLEEGCDKAAGKGQPCKTVNVYLIKDGKVTKLSDDLKELDECLPIATATPEVTAEPTPEAGLKENPAGVDCDFQLGKEFPKTARLTKPAIVHGDVVLKQEKTGKTFRTYDSNGKAGSISEVDASENDPWIIIADPEGKPWGADVFACDPKDFKANTEQGIKHLSEAIPAMVLQGGAVQRYPKQ